MAQYGISVRGILKRTVIVEAENIDEAIQKVEEVGREEIILGVDDYDDREIMPTEYWDGGKVPDGKMLVSIGILEKITKVQDFI